MKNLLFIALASVLFASCAPDYHNKIIARGTAQQCQFVTDSMASALMVTEDYDIRPSVAGNPQACDSVYTVEMTVGQKWHAGNKWLLFSGIFIFLAGFLNFAVSTSGGNNKESSLGWVIGGLIIGGLLVGGFYCFSSSRDILKVNYDKYILTDGDLHNFWSTPAQSY